jgi:hypothetical protein
VICPDASQFDELVPVTVYWIEEFGDEVTDATFVTSRAVDGAHAYVLIGWPVAEAFN